MNEEQNFPPAIGDGEGEVPLAKQPTEKIDVRTMSSDIASMQETGGNMPHAYNPSTTGINNNRVDAGGPSFSPQNINDGFETTNAVSSTPNTNIPKIPPVTAKSTPQTPEWGEGSKPAKKKKSAFGWILAIIIIAGILAIGYFFVLPMLSEESPADINQELNNEIVPVNNEPIETVPEVIEPPIGSTLEIHSSLLQSPADLVFDVPLPGFSYADMKSALTFTSTSLPVFKEVVFKTNSNKPMAFSYILNSFFPSFFTNEITNKFESDGTIFAYTNTAGTWLGFIAKFKDTGDISAMQNEMATLQSSPDLINAFLSDPGTIGAWEDGKIAGKPASLVRFSNTGAVFGYAWFDKYLLIGSNIDGSNEAAKRLGY